MSKSMPNSGRSGLSLVESRIYLQVINNFASNIVRLNGQEEVLWEVAKNVIGRLGFVDCVIYRYDGENKTLVQKAAFGVKNPKGMEIVNPITIRLGEGISGAVAKNRRGEIVHDTSKDKRYLEDDDLRYSELCVPIIHEDRLLGVIDSEHPEKYFFTTEHFDILTTIASMTASKLAKIETMEALEVSKQDLESQVIEQTSELRLELQARKQTEKKLIRAKEELEKRNAELKRFAYVVSHDLKAPLRGIGSLVDILKQNKAIAEDEESMEQLGLMKNRVRRMYAFINGLLQYSKIGFENSSYEEIDLPKVIPEIVAILPKPENTMVVYSNELPTIFAQKILILQVFQNLIENALKFMDKEAGKIIIGSREDDDYWELFVADNGPGIEEKYFDKIFQLFQTLRPRDEQENTGIGLTLVKKMVELHGGKIWVDSNPGIGTCITFTIGKEKEGSQTGD